MSENLDRLKIIRRSHRGVVTKLTREADTLIADTPLNSERIDRLTVIRQQLESKEQLLLDYDRDILAKCTLDEVEAEVNDTESVIAKILECKRRIELVLQPPSTHSTTSTASITGVASVPGASRARLPKLSLAKFKGDVTGWVSFWDSFKSAVHENNDISKIDKFNYLNSLLEGTAALTIQGLTLTADNYDSAIELLKKRFGNTQQIIATHMEELLRLPASHGDRAQSLRRLYDNLMVHIRGLSSLGIETAQYGSILVPVLLSKLPDVVRLRIARENRGEAWEINCLMGIILEEVQARETSEGTKILTPRPAIPPRMPSNNNNPTSSSLVTNSNPAVKCVYCGEVHYSAACKKVVSVKERKEILKRLGRCYNCLRPNHRVRDCESRRNCRYCHHKHHQSLCKSRPADKGDDHTGEQETPTQDTTVNTSNSVKGQHLVLLQTARVEATNEGNNKTENVRILFDNGSQRSYITDSLKEKLGLSPIKKEKLNLNTFGDSKFKTQRCDVVRVYLRKPGNEKVFYVDALSFPTICSALPSSVKLGSHSSITSLELADHCGSTGQNQIDILVGSNFYWSFVTGEIVRTDKGLVAVCSELGWLLSGPVDSCIPNEPTHTNLVVNYFSEPDTSEPMEDQLVLALKRFWEVETFGIEDEGDKLQDETFLRKLEFKNRHYEVSLPWIRDHCDLPNHYQQCLNRLKLLRKRLFKNPEILNEYNSVIQDQLSKGIIERVPTEDQGSTIHYMPHHPVIRKERSTTKVRIVYDGSAKFNDSISLNDCLQTGPNLIPKLFDVLIRYGFRNNRIALTADIEKAFLMIGINKSDRDMLRFLWFTEPHREDSEVMQLRFTRLVFGLRPSPAILGAVITHHAHKYRDRYPELVSSIEQSLYVDDLITGADTVEDAFRLYKVAKLLMSEGGFNLRKWNSSSQSLLSRINSDQGNCEDRPLVSHQKSSPIMYEPANKLLGIQWIHDTDEFSFQFDELQSHGRSLPSSKRSVLRITAAIFDPMGFLSPFVIQLKVMFQKLCVNKAHWDDPLPKEMADQWNKMLQEFEFLHGVTIPRCYFDPEKHPVSIQLHGFSDALELAYAAVLYLRTLYSDASVTVNLVASKTKVAPLKRQSIPRLELLGALILAKLTQVVARSIPKLSEHFFWVDSMTVLCWIRNDRVWKQYVQHRVDEIRKISDKKAWRHCPGRLNPADLPSRGISASELNEQMSWWKGPTFLMESSSSWPNAESCDIVAEAKAEMVKSIPPITISLLTTGSPFVHESIDELINCENYSNVNHIFRVTAYVIRFIKKCKKQPGARGSNVTRSEMNYAELLWIRAVQHCSFAREIQYLKSPTFPCPVLVNQFGLFLDDQQVLRCKGRLNNSSLCLQSKNPAILPQHHRIVELLVLWAHRKVKHSGVSDTLTYLRESYWILKGRQVVRKIIKSCVVCRRLEGPSYPAVPAPDLPFERVSEHPPFTHTGVDFAGPLYVAEKDNTGKAYICLFTCASTRAVHLELTHDMGMDSFLLAIRRFASRRGLPATLMSDNAKTFQSSAKELIKISRSKEMNQYLTNNRIMWKFIVEKAPWWGGYWERMVQGVKRCLKKTIGRSCLTYDQLQTLITEVESIINARPLTYVQDDIDGISYTLSPSHLIYGRRIADRPNDSHFDIVSTTATLTKRYKIHKHLLTQFTNQWRKNYLTGLRESHCINCTRTRVPIISVDDVVVLKDDSTKRTFWKLAVVKELIPGRDGKIRAAWVRVANDNAQPRLLKRSTQHLYPVEVNSSGANPN